MRLITFKYYKNQINQLVNDGELDFSTTKAVLDSWKDNFKLIKEEESQTMSYSYYSFQSKTHRSKIALIANPEQLGVENKAKSIPLVLEDNQSTPLRTAMKFLMRGNKVSILTINLEPDQSLESWMEEKFHKKLYIKEDSKFLLLYFKKSKQKKILAHAEVEFYNNGIAKLTRRYRGVNDVGKEKDIIDTYYGEFNVKHKDRDGNYIYLKLIKMNFEKGELHQEYRELFITFFWPVVPLDNFDFTRGIITSDKDRQKGIKRNSMSSNICVLCNINQKWQEIFGETNPFHNFKNIEDRSNRFLDRIITESTIEDQESGNYSIDLTYDLKFCEYENFLKRE